MAPSSGSGSGRFLALAQVAGVLVTAGLVWIYAVSPRLGRQSVASLIAESLFYVVLAWGCGGIVTFCVYLVVSLADLPDVVRFSLRSSAPAMWFAPAFILLSEPAPAAVAVSFVLIANATRLLVAQWVGIESPLSETIPAPAGYSFLFGIPEEYSFFSRNWASVLLGSFTAQAGLVAMLWHHSLIAAAFLASSAAILTSLSIVTGAWRPDRPAALPPSLLSVAVTLLLASTLSFGGMVVGRGGGFGSPTTANSPSTERGDPASSTVTTTVATPEDGGEVGGGFPGVVLLPLVRPHATLLVPVPAKPNIFSMALTHSFGIPFSGEYWMFKPPRLRPPLRSIVRRGRPTDLAFHTTDGTFMEMEARQKLTPAIDVNCCSRIQIMITDADPYPGTVALELFLVSIDAKGEKAQSLGTESLDEGRAVDRTVTFSIPAGSTVRRFDEFRIVFHRHRIRADKSARIAIDRFVLLP